MIRRHTNANLANNARNGYTEYLREPTRVSVTWIERKTLALRPRAEIVGSRTFDRNVSRIGETRNARDRRGKGRKKERNGEERREKRGRVLVREKGKEKAKNKTDASFRESLARNESTEASSLRAFENEKPLLYAAGLAGSATRCHTSVVTRARVNMATQPGIREDAYYFKVRFACASNNQSRCVTLDKSVKKLAIRRGRGRGTPTPPTGSNSD